MKKSFFDAVFTVNIVIWVFFGVVSLICSPHWQDHGYYADNVDFNAPAVAYEHAPEALKPVIKVTDPVMYLIEPFEEGEPGWENTLTMLGALFLLLIYVVTRASVDEDKDIKAARRWKVFDVILMLYLLLCLSVIVSGMFL